MGMVPLRQPQDAGETNTNMEVNIVGPSIWAANTHQHLQPNQAGKRCSSMHLCRFKLLCVQVRAFVCVKEITCVPPLTGWQPSVSVPHSNNSPVATHRIHPAHQVFLPALLCCMSCQAQSQTKDHNLQRQSLLSTRRPPQRMHKLQAGRPLHVHACTQPLLHARACQLAAVAAPAPAWPHTQSSVASKECLIPSAREQGGIHESQAG